MNLCLLSSCSGTRTPPSRICIIYRFHNASCQWCPPPKLFWSIMDIFHIQHVASLPIVFMLKRLLYHSYSLLRDVLMLWHQKSTLPICFCYELSTGTALSECSDLCTWITLFWLVFIPKGETEPFYKVVWDDGRFLMPLMASKFFQEWKRGKSDPNLLCACEAPACFTKACAGELPRELHPRLNN